jgi:hypothetical protein
MNTLNARLLTTTVTCLSLSFCLSASAGPDGGCAIDEPCFNGARQVGNKIIFNFTGTSGAFDFYNVRYPVAGGGEKQVENHSGSFTFNNVKPRSVYKISVQGCNSHPLRRSTCSAWVQESVTTK